jgi:hypothetical protein
MAIVGRDLENGVRVEAERPITDGPPWSYQGEAVTRRERFRLAANVDVDGAVSVALEPDPPPGLAEKVRLIIRSAWRHAAEGGAPPPRRIARWRAER